MNFVVADDDGTVHDADDDLDAIRRPAGGDGAGGDRRGGADRASGAGIVDWDVGTLPQVVETSRGGHVVRGYPALLDDDDSVSLRVLTNPDLQQRVMRGGVRRLLLLTAAPSARDVQRGARPAPAAWRSPPAASPLDELVADCRVAAVDRVMADHGELPWDADAFAALQRAVRARRAGRRRRRAGDGRRHPRRRGPGPAPARPAGRAGRRARRSPTPGPTSTGSSGPGSSSAAGTRRLPDVHRYVRAIEYRLDRLADDVPRDVRRMAEVVPARASATRRCCGAAGAARSPPTSSSSAGSSRSCGSACSPSRSAPTAR